MTPTPRAGRAILMYHAVSGAAGDACGADERYTITRATLARQLRALRTRVGAARAVRDVLLEAALIPTASAERGGRVGRAQGAGASQSSQGSPDAVQDSTDARSGALPPPPPRSALDVCLTFDDGHVTNYTEALPLLLEHGASADFFVNPALVGTPGFASWAQLREMADAGMSIQSHGDDHAYFTALSPNALERQLRRSKGEIEDRIGRPCTLLAPPGGRMPPLLPSVACALGYEAIACSEPGRWTDEASIVLPRHAVTSTTQLEDLVGWALGDARATRGPALRHAVLGIAKRALGDARYERLRARLLARRVATAHAGDVA